MNGLGLYAYKWGYSPVCVWMSALLLVCGVHPGRSATTTVNLFSLCGDGRNPNYQIPLEDTVVVNITGWEWPVGAKRCPVIFYSHGDYDSVMYEFKHFSVADKDTRIVLRATAFAYFSLVGDYDWNNTAPIGEMRETSVHLKIRPERLNLTDESLFAIIELRNQDWVEKMNKTRHQNPLTEGKDDSSAVKRFPGGVLIAASLCIVLVSFNFLR